MHDATLDVPVEGTPALYQVGDPAFLTRHDPMATYAADPRVGHTGWLVRPAGCQPLPYELIRFDRFGYTVGIIDPGEWPTSLL